MRSFSGTKQLITHTTLASNSAGLTQAMGMLQSCSFSPTASVLTKGEIRPSYLMTLGSYMSALSLFPNPKARGTVLICRLQLLGPSL